MISSLFITIFETSLESGFSYHNPTHTKCSDYNTFLVGLQIRILKYFLMGDGLRKVIGVECVWKETQNRALGGSCVNGDGRDWNVEEPTLTAWGLSLRKL